jgi:hypothetical protein
LWRRVHRSMVEKARGAMVMMYVLDGIITVTYYSYRYSTILFLDLQGRVQGIDCKFGEIFL